MKNRRPSLSRGALTALALSTSLLVGACAAATKPQPQLDARASFVTAEPRPAGRLTPAELVDTQRALDEAERSYEDDDATDAAYIAQRRAQIASSRQRGAQRSEDR